MLLPCTGESGGAIYSKGVLYIQNSSFTDNTAKTAAAINVNNADAVITGSLFHSNIAQQAGAISSSQQLTVFNTVFTANNATVGAGGAIVSNSNCSIDNCTFTHNACNQYGGAILSGQDASLTISNSIMTSNTALFAGGAVFTLSTTSTSQALQIIGNTVQFSNNTASCCYANNGLNSSAVQYTLAGTSETTCLDVDGNTGISNECCLEGYYSNGEKCQLCTDELTCSDTIGATTSTLSLAAGLWRTSTDTLTVYSCLNSNACSGGIALTSTDDYCATGYKGPCKYTSVYILYTYMMLAVDCNFMECVYVSTMKPLYNT
jgi:predicted outer membrane repeat protein